MKTLYKRILKGKFLIDILILSLLSIYVFIGSKKAPFHGDEATLISMSRDYFYLFKENDFEKLMYKQNWTNDQHIRIAAGSIEPFAIWLSLKIAGYNENNLSGIWVWSASDEGLDPKTNMWQWNINKGNMPEKKVLFISRIPSTLFTVLSIIMVFLIVVSITNSHIPALLSAIIYTTTPAILLNGRLAMQEGATLFFCTLMIYISIIIIKQYKKTDFNWRSILLKYNLLGIISGLAMACKHNTLLIIIPIYITLFITPMLLMKNRQSKLTKYDIFRHILILIITANLSIVLFIALMPIWWGFLLEALLLLLIVSFLYTFCLNTLKNWLWAFRSSIILIFVAISVTLSISITDIQWPFIITIKYRQILMEAQTKSSPDPLYSAKSRTNKLIEELFFAKSQYYEASEWVINKEMAQQIQQYEYAHLDGRSGGLFWGFLLVILTGTGIIALCLDLRKNALPEVLLIFLWFGVPLLLLLLTNTLPWQRYYIVLYAPMSIFAGIGLNSLKEYIKVIS